MKNTRIFISLTIIATLTIISGGCQCCKVESKCCQQKAEAEKCQAESFPLEPKVVGRGWEEKIVFSDNGDLRHAPISFDDYTKVDNNDDKAVDIWTRQDACSLFKDPFIFLGEGTVLPYKAAKTPPTTETVSRGNIKWKMPEHEWGLQ